LLGGNTSRRSGVSLVFEVHVRRDRWRRCARIGKVVRRQRERLEQQDAQHMGCTAERRPCRDTTTAKPLAHRTASRHLGNGTQQPVMQYASGPHPPRVLGSHEGTPTGQLGPVAPEHEVGNVDLPTQSSHSSQVFWQPSTGVHGGHAVGSALLASSQWLASSTAPIQTKRPLAAGSSQQPKQSQPLGVSGKQLDWQAAGGAPPLHTASAGS
jgi:hypothetical protein